MKRKWEEPRIEVQKFEANEYVAACWYFSETNIVIQQPFTQTDGKSNTPEEYQMGFRDDDWDFLAGQEDTMEDPNQKGWYCTTNTYPLHPDSPAPELIKGGPWGNHVIKDMAYNIYYYGGGPYRVTEENCTGLGVGPNAS